MSGFRESFTRNAGADGSLQHDDTAFGFFLISVLITATVPLSIHILKKILINPMQEVARRAPKSKVAQETASKLVLQNQNAYLTTGFFLKLFILLILVISIRSVYSNVIAGQDTIKQFDPYEILELDRTATEADIQKSHRKLFLKWHPDKNPENPQATAIFILISKAYECLTDEKKRHLCEKFGNPDGNQSTQVAIALPKFLLYKENQIVLLVIFFIVLLVIVPSIGYWLYTQSSQTDENGILVQNTRHFWERLNENLIIQNCVDILAGAQEYEEIPFVEEQKGDLLKLLKMINETELAHAIPQKGQGPTESNQFLKAQVLISAHVHNFQIPEQLQADYAQIITLAPSIIQSMINFSLQFKDRVNPQTKMQKLQLRMFGYQFMGMQCTGTLIEFQQLITQGLWNKDHPIFQLSAFQKDKDDSLRRTQKLNDLRELIQTPRDQRKMPYIPEQYLNDTHEEIESLPNLKVEWKVHVPDEDLIVEGDLIQISIVLDRLNYSKDDEVRYAHTAAFPGLKEEQWHVILASEGQILRYFLLQGFKKRLEKTLKIQEKAGDNEFQLIVQSDSYRGFDQEHTIQFTVLPQKDVQRQTIEFEEDIELEKKPSLFTQLMMNLNNKTVDSDEELEDEEAEKQRIKEKQRLEAEGDHDQDEEEEGQDEEEENEIVEKGQQKKKNEESNKKKKE